MRRVLAVLSLLLVAAGGLAVLRAQEQDAQVPVFRGGVDSVVVDVIVTDGDGRPITDLTAADFEVREAGDPQSIDTFRLVETDDGYDDATAVREILSFDDQRRETAREENRLFVIFLDEYHVRRGNSMIVREEIARFLTRLTPHDLVGIVTPTSIISGLTFSRNHVATANVVRGFVGRKYDYTPMTPIEARYQNMSPVAQEQFRNDMVVNALSNLSIQLGSLREGRKTMLYVSEGMSGYVPEGVRTIGGPIGSAVVDRPGDPNQSSRDFFESAALTNDMQRVFQAASRNNVAIYTLDPRGLANFEFSLGDYVDEQEDRQVLAASIDMLRSVAEETDGRAIVARNDPIPALEQMVRDSGTYYLLGYVSTRAPRDGKFHPIEVKVNRPGVQVRARKGYWAFSAEDISRAAASARPAAPAEVIEALDVLTGTVDARSARTVSLWSGAERGEAERARVTIAWAPVARAVADPETVDHVLVDVRTSAGEEIFSGSIASLGTGDRAGGHVSFDAPPGTLDVDVRMENASGRRLDADAISVDVPDFTAAGPIVGTPFVFTGRTARDIQAVRAAESPMPVVRREFSRRERLLVRFSAYGPAGVTPEVGLRLLNSNGESMTEMPPPTSDGGTFESEFSLSAFPPGDFLLEITATVGGETARQLVGIRVTG